MILLSRFGYALRHEIRFHGKAKRGALTLWSNYEGKGVATDPLVNGTDRITEFLAHQFAFRGALFGANYSAEFPLGSDKDLFSILAAVTMLKKGREYAFSNYQDRLISFSRQQVGKDKQEIITVKIRYSNKIGVLVPEEIRELESLIRNILSELGYSKQGIADELENTIAETL
jgi:hypothetical protein